MEMALQVGDALLETIRSQFTMSMTDADGTILDVNDAFCETTQYSRAELIGANHRILKSGYHTAEFFEQMWQKITSGNSWRGEICNRAKNGSLYWIDSVIAPIPGPDGTPARFISIRSDITGRRAELEDWRERKERLRRLIDTTPAMLHSIDGEGRLLTVNDRWLDKLGYKRDEVIGRLSADFMTEKSRAQTLSDLLPHLLRDGYIEDTEIQMVRKDGSVIDVLLSAVLERDATGKPLRSSTVLVDITALKQAERKIAASEALFKDIVDEHVEMVSLATIDGEVTYANRAYAQHFGTTPAEMVGRNFYDFIPEADRPAVRRHVEKVCSSGETQTDENPMLSADGDPRWIAWINRPLTDDEGRVVGIHSVGRDITDRKRAESQLKRANQIVTIAADAAGMGFWDWNVSTNKLTWDRGMFRLYGRPRALGQQPYVLWANSLHPDDRARCEREARGALDGKRPYRSEFRIIHPGGQVRHLVAAASIARDDDVSDDIHMFGVTFDITERKIFEAALLEANDRFAVAADAAGIGVWDWNIKTNVLVWDDWMFRIYGRSQTDGKVTYDLWVATMHPDDRARCQQELLALSHGLTATSNMEFRILRHDGEERHIKSAAALKRGTAGAIEHVFGVNFDITERKRFEEKLTESNYRFATASRAAGLGFWEWDIKASTFVGDEAVFRNYGRTMPTSQAEASAIWANSLHPEDREHCQQIIREALAGARPFEMEYRIIHPNGDVRHLTSAAAVIRDADGNPTKLLGLNFDITARKQAEIQLQRMVGELTRINEDVENFAYIASHDLKAPLRGIGYLAEMVVEELGQSVSQTVRDNLELMQSRIDRMTSLTDDLLAYSRAGQADGEIVAVDTRKLVEDVFDLAATTKPIRLEASADLPVLRTRKAPLELVLRNLIGNAIKHHDKPQGRITVSAVPTTDGYEFAVADDGPGIPPEEQDRVFGMFHMLKSREEVEGSGMGLAIIKKTVESVNGRVSLESDGKHGCIFRFTWPSHG